ncbi:hypothetical protein EV715DRAFT_202964 [Schizophyllum commune]
MLLESLRLEPLESRTTLCERCGSSIFVQAASVPLTTLRSQVLPEGGEITDVQHAIHLNENAASILEGAIARAQATLDDLRAQHSAVVLNTARQRALLAPVRRLPREIITAILGLVISYSFSRRPNTTRSVMHHSVMRVCHLWRAVIQCYAPVWANIKLYPLSDPFWHRTLHACLRYSGSLPLDIYLGRDYSRLHYRQRLKDAGRIQVPQKEWAVVARPLLRSAYRWRSIHLESIELPLSVFDNKKISLPLLTKLILDHADLSRGLFERSPALSDVRLEGMEQKHLILPWDRLETLEIISLGYMHDRPCMHMLHACVNLRHLTINCREESLERQDVHLPMLETIIEKGTGGVLQSLRAPRLRQISIGDSQGMDVLLDFRTRNPEAGATVSHLTFHVGGLAERDWNAFFKAFPNIVRLEICDSNDRWYAEGPAPLFASLADALADRAGQAVPSLRELVLPEFAVEDMGDIAMLQKLARERTTNRSIGVARLEEIQIRNPYSHEFGTYLDDLRTQGVNIPIPPDFTFNPADYATSSGYEFDLGEGKGPITHISTSDSEDDKES